MSEWLDKPANKIIEGITLPYRLLMGDEKGGDPGLGSEVRRGYLNPQSTAAYKAAAGEAAAQSAEQRAMTAAAYGDRGLAQSGYAEAAQQQVGVNQQRALADAIGEIQLRYLTAALGMREQDIYAQAAREQAIAQGIGSVFGAGGELGGAAIMA